MSRVGRKIWFLSFFVFFALLLLLLIPRGPVFPVQVETTRVNPGKTKGKVEAGKREDKIGLKGSPPKRKILYRDVFCLLRAV